MAPLIEITNVPIEIEMKVSHAKLEYTHGTADLEISRQNGGLSIKSSSIRLNVDTFEPSGTVSSSGVAGGTATYAATTAYAQQGQLFLEAQVDPQIAAQFSHQFTSSQVSAADGTGGEWDSAVMNIRFEMDKLNFDWRMNQTQFEFIPGDIEISVTQQPDVIIKYVGGPLYAPPSSDPNYEPVDVKA